MRTNRIICGLLAVAVFSCSGASKQEIRFEVEAPEEAVVGEPVTFRDLSAGVQSRTWTFSNADVITTSEPFPAVTFKKAGNHICSIKNIMVNGDEMYRGFSVKVVDPEQDPEQEEYDDVGGILKISKIHIIEEPEDMFLRGIWPDSRLIPVKNGNKWQLFWAEAYSVLTEADTPWPEDHITQVTKENAVFGMGFDCVPNYNDYGSWFIGIFPQPQKDPAHYVGFYHGECHRDNGAYIKTIGVAYSEDYGRTWHDPAPILCDERGLEPEYYHPAGLGDGCVMWDPVKERYICIYQTLVGDNSLLCMAISEDPEGHSGTWKKWDGKGFTITGYDPKTGFGGFDVAIPNLSSVAGANPSIMWNYYLNKWVMVYHSWSQKVYMTFSDDLVNWSEPIRITLEPTQRSWYPNMISEDGGDLRGGKKIRMYFSSNMDFDTGQRDLAYQTIIFN